ncbi:MAG: cytochrome c [Vicinamibacterales bacterium]
MIRFTAGVVIGVILTLVAAAGVVRLTRLDATIAPGFLERQLMAWLRTFSVPGDVAARANPVPATAEVLRDARAHYADHCAVCHAADGSGDTAMGRGFSPRPPDLRAGATQRQRDGVLFQAIERGVRFTGMPAFTTGTPDGEAASWALVHLIREMPRWTAADVEDVRARQPRPPADVRREIEEERFLAGGN